ncbi:MAG: hypothetical protein BI182_06330 [Acetobacterium sp. MES1]|uniref:hypothetical protein n=1 Tax=Acetobacterium sp. MES1 TaxID=1899015 RepID=UPI000B9D454E|nr:hypothetical protein [Acetobacterium sp. MES1]OXS27075.1 MAG: hypothetical protein BI182_06330 [Acetobacterium sp. MES1]
MNPIAKYQFPPAKNEPVAFDRGFPLAVVSILFFVVVIIAGLVLSSQHSANAANARLVYLAAQARAIESAATGHYQVPVQDDLLDYIGVEVNQDAVITVVDENRDATIDYIVYRRGGRVTSYSPGNLEVTKEK